MNHEKARHLHDSLIKSFEPLETIEECKKYLQDNFEESIKNGDINIDRLGEAPTFYIRYIEDGKEGIIVGILS